MALIEFKNLPDTSTPITAENLNNNFNELIFKPKIATAYLTTPQSNLTSGVILLDSIRTSTENLTLSNNGILIGDGISQVKISANIFIEEGASNGYLWGEIRKNGTAIIRNLDNSNSTYASASFAPFLINVEQGDLIQIYKAGDNNSVKIRGYNQNSYNTYLTIEIVN